jgi:hypothetical protein
MLDLNVENNFCKKITQKKMQALVKRNMKMSSDAGSRYKRKPMTLEVTLNDQINYTSISI